ncbi:hypothetical protein pb186bvf_002645 [Paramecium bursaria]
MKNPFFDQYEIIDKLGQGGQSEVSLCKEKSTNELFAVKIRSGNQEYIDREIDILASVQSKYFVKIKATISHKQFDYIILEYCNGKTLLEKANEHYFSEKDILEFFNFILGAQYELIQMGIIHRDLKLSNILIHNGQYKLADFGISRSVYNYDQAGQITAFSHPSYNRSPQFNTRKYTSKCDVWSLGIIIYYLLFKQYPWTLDETNIQKYYNDCKILTFPQERVISQSMRELIQGCLAYEEKDRFSWTDLMKRKILGYEFSDYIKLEQQLKNIEIQLALKIMENAFQEHQTTIEQFRKDTNNLDLNKHERIAYFQNRAKKYNNQLETFQIVYIFNQIDQKHQEFIDQQQNENWLKRCKLLSEMVKQLQIQNQEDRIIIKQLFVMIYFKLQDNNLNIEQLIDEYECTFMNKRQGFILPNEFQTFIRYYTYCQLEVLIKALIQQIFKSLKSIFHTKIAFLLWRLPKFTNNFGE